MNLPIGVYGLIIGVCALIAFGSGIWLVLRARDLVKLTADPENNINPGRERKPKPPASTALAGVLLVVMIVASAISLGLFAAIATGAINSSHTRTDPYAQRP